MKNQRAQVVEWKSFQVAAAATLAAVATTGSARPLFGERPEGEHGPFSRKEHGIGNAAQGDAAHEIGGQPR